MADTNKSKEESSMPISSFKFQFRLRKSLKRTHEDRLDSSIVQLDGPNPPTTASEDNHSSKRDSLSAKTKRKARSSPSSSSPSSFPSFSSSSFSSSSSSSASSSSPSYLAPVSPCSAPVSPSDLPCKQPFRRMPPFYCDKCKTIKPSSERYSESQLCVLHPDLVYCQSCFDSSMGSGRETHPLCDPCFYILVRRGQIKACVICNAGVFIRPLFLQQECLCRECIAVCCAKCVEKSERPFDSYVHIASDTMMTLCRTCAEKRGDTIRDAGAPEDYPW
eukprot:TRINITY_DN2587_c0_g1_i2.p1 TRINITY_DN2587_c0_g1~~TRINITY_DN2587_c0_g1_i2.p1  ORF type:complete len:276 (-),score=14.86 TRINITY_DN2587_c0_g1_i2:28-855(-)